MSQPRMPPWSLAVLLIAMVMSTADSVNISMTADNYIRELYFDGTLIPTNHGGWGYVLTFDLPANIRIIAVRCENTEDIAGFLASTFDDSVLTNSSWKCTSQNVSNSNWYSVAFDDSSWPYAVIGAQNGGDAHGPRPGISLNAGWIWTADNGYINSSVFDPVVYCRSWNLQFPAPTPAATAQTTTPAPIATSASIDPYTLAITADNYLREVYFDGQLFPTDHQGWGETLYLKMPTNISVIAVKCENQDAVAGVLASTTDGSLLTDRSWKCTSQVWPNWASPSFNDASWPAAVQVSQNTNDDEHGQRPGISTNAYWIWTANNGFNNTAFDPVVFCRSPVLPLTTATTAAMTTATTTTALSSNDLGVILGSVLGVFGFLLFLIFIDFVVIFFCL